MLRSLFKRCTENHNCILVKYLFLGGKNNLILIPVRKKYLMNTTESLSIMKPPEKKFVRREQGKTIYGFFEESIASSEVFET